MPDLDLVAAHQQGRVGQVDFQHGAGVHARHQMFPAGLDCAAKIGDPVRDGPGLRERHDLVHHFLAALAGAQYALGEIAILGIGGGIL